MKLRRGIDEPLQAWFDQWLLEYKESKMFAHSAAQEQIMFVRDELAPLVWSGVPYDLIPREDGSRDDCPVSGRVISEHSSKSVRLPVYQLDRADLGLQFTLRGNFRDWKLSVESKKPLWSEVLPCLFHTTAPSGSYDDRGSFEGFPSNRIFGYYASNPRCWSASIDRNSQLWAVVMCCMRSVGAISPMVR
jgi:hypothetical protein